MASSQLRRRSPQRRGWRALEAGAYQEISASNFNALPRPATVLVNGQDADIVKRDETAEDVWARDVVPDRFRRAPEVVSATMPDTPTSR